MKSLCRDIVVSAAWSGESLTLLDGVNNGYWISHSQLYQQDTKLLQSHKYHGSNKRIYSVAYEHWRPRCSRYSQCFCCDDQVYRYMGSTIRRGYCANWYVAFLVNDHH